VEVEIIDVSENNTQDLTLDDIREPPNIQRSSIVPGSSQWTSPVPYVLDEGLDLRAKGVIMRAFDQFRVKSCIDFKPWDSEDYYINIKKADGCWSYIGRVFTNGQDLSIGEGCDYIAIVEHEILHALGFYHEQSRYDRDDYVRIVFSNILSGRTDIIRFNHMKEIYQKLYLEQHFAGQQTGYFIHASTASGQEGDSARLETQVVKPTRACNVQCLQFYYFHSGNEADELNIWIREFENDQDTTGTLRLMGQITGSPTSHWKIHHVSLNATKDFQVVFEVRKGAGISTGGFSIDDINLSETECPHFVWQIDDLENLLNTSSSGTQIYSKRQFSKDGYAYRVATILFKTYIGMYVQLLSSQNDERLQYPCLQRHMIFQLLDQTPNKQLQMSKESTLVSDKTQVLSGTNTSIWDNPRKTGVALFYDKGELVYGGRSLRGSNPFTLQEMQSREFLKGGSAIFMFNFEDLTPLINGTTLPCPQL
ncbi:PREDICTED: meprin A subunit beta-like, partial [Poecilia mexicana]|uniref:meprin A subunit beta-like n=1 Tax=Poecilia mexicana TaxID=48701 RepID=UPI00072EBDC4